MTAVGYVTATFEIEETQIDSRWSTDQEIIRPGVPVYLAEPGSFEPDLSRIMTQEQAQEIQKLPGLLPGRHLFELFPPGAGSTSVRAQGLN